MSLGKGFSCRVANLKDNHVITGDFIKNEAISNGHHPVLEIVVGKGGIVPGNLPTKDKRCTVLRGDFER